MNTSITQVTTIRAAIAAIAESGKALDSKIQETALLVLSHVDQHGDVTLVNELYRAMPKGSRSASLVDWLLAFGKVRANTGKDKEQAPFRFDGTKTTQIDEASLMPWHMMGKPERKPDEVFDVVKALESILRKAGKANAVTDPALVDRVRSLIGVSYEAPTAPETATEASADPLAV